jgi:hypothetical protein
MKAPLLLAALLALAPATGALAQESKSAPLAKQLAAALDAGKLDSLAAKDPSNPDVYVGVLYFPGVQLLAVSAKYAAPSLLDARLTKREYRDVYMDLYSAATAGTKVFITDLGVDGVRARANGDAAPDGYESGGKLMSFDGEWDDQKLSEQEYQKAYAAADERYSQMLTALLAQLKNRS